MAVHKQRATTSKTYAMDICYTKALADAKRIHRDDGKFYMDKIADSYTSDNQIIILFGKSEKYLA